MEVLILVLAAVMAGAEAFTEIRALREGEAAAAPAVFGFGTGTPPARHAGRHLRARFRDLSEGFAASAARCAGVPGEARGDRRQDGAPHLQARGEAAIHVVTACAVERRLVLGAGQDLRRSRTRSPRSRMPGSTSSRLSACTDFVRPSTAHVRNGGPVEVRPTGMVELLELRINGELPHRPGCFCRPRARLSEQGRPSPGPEQPLA